MLSGGLGRPGISGSVHIARFGMLPLLFVLVDCFDVVILFDLIVIFVIVVCYVFEGRRHPRAAVCCWYAYASLGAVESNMASLMCCCSTCCLLLLYLV